MAQSELPLTLELVLKEEAWLSDSLKDAISSRPAVLVAVTTNKGEQKLLKLGLKLLPISAS